MTYKITIYGKKIESQEFTDEDELITEVHYLIKHKLIKGKITGLYVEAK